MLLLQSRPRLIYIYIYTCNPYSNPLISIFFTDMWPTGYASIGFWRDELLSIANACKTCISSKLPGRLGSYLKRLFFRFNIHVTEGHYSVEINCWSSREIPPEPRSHALPTDSFVLRIKYILHSNLLFYPIALRDYILISNALHPL